MNATTAFVFAGGGSLGAVQVGMLKALARAGIAPDFVVGASVGAINGACYAASPDVAGVERFCDALERFLMTVSWGGYESLAFPVCAVFPKDAPLRPANGGASLNFVRLSIGLEEPSVLIADLDQALARI